MALKLRGPAVHKLIQGIEKCLISINFCKIALLIQQQKTVNLTAKEG
ncbi:Uncharacterised protein [Yokenella regensburgei]|uniref:Uncharacterized protein n=1 Tax=Yokenella regensburgei TaxID=158877 RepID=A0AB38FRQ5_9ENTR|nr:Uncharacterised protein [Yokenella regensburgei]SQA67188.1 Uncharacterised protein [Yokenella regensburgei]SUQ05632.1 Uncharacterised protein [Yokenella regensburgei]